jgi:hypothetical protein
MDARQRKIRGQISGWLVVIGLIPLLIAAHGPMRPWLLLAAFGCFISAILVGGDAL